MEGCPVRIDRLDSPPEGEKSKKMSLFLMTLYGRCGFDRSL